MDLQEFRALPTQEICKLVQAASTDVCVFTIEGTRRWYLLEHMQDSPENYLDGYFDAALHRYAEVFAQMYEHGLNTLVVPMFQNFLMKRSPAYVRKAVDGLVALAAHPTMRDLYDHYDIRVQVYGDYQRVLDEIGSPHAPAFDALVEQTSMHRTRRMFMGILEDDPVETIVRHTLYYYEQYHHAPDRQALIEMYYGEAVAPFDLYIGYDRFSADDMPLLAAGNQDLFFMMAPSLSLTETQLRDILYAHLYTPLDHRPEYTDLNGGQLDSMRVEYEASRQRTFRVAVQPASGEVAVTRSV
jgi:adenosine tuberculosinyltransferase